MRFLILNSVELLVGYYIYFATKLCTYCCYVHYDDSTSSLDLLHFLFQCQLPPLKAKTNSLLSLNKEFQTIVIFFKILM